MLLLSMYLKLGFRSQFNWNIILCRVYNYQDSHGLNHNQIFIKRMLRSVCSFPFFGMKREKTLLYFDDVWNLKKNTIDQNQRDTKMEFNTMNFFFLLEIARWSHQNDLNLRVFFTDCLYFFFLIIFFWFYFLF